MVGVGRRGANDIIIIMVRLSEWQGSGPISFQLGLAAPPPYRALGSSTVMSCRFDGDVKGDSLMYVCALSAPRAPALHSEAA